MIVICCIFYTGNFRGKCICKTLSHLCRNTTANFMNKDDQEALLVILCLIGCITVYKFLKKLCTCLLMPLNNTVCKIIFVTCIGLFLCLLPNQ